jgi:hypothetical protein
VIRSATIADIPVIDALTRPVPGFWDESWRPDALDRVLRSPDAIALAHAEADTIDRFVCGHDIGFRA